MDLLVPHEQITTGRNLGNAVRTELLLLELISGQSVRLFMEPTWRGKHPGGEKVEIDDRGCI